MAPEDELGEGVDTISNSPVVGEAQAVEQGEGTAAITLRWACVAWPATCQPCQLSTLFGTVSLLTPRCAISLRYSRAIPSVGKIGVHDRAAARIPPTPSGPSSRGRPIHSLILVVPAHLFGDAVHAFAELICCMMVAMAG